jgi:lipopolysaccharide assembly outer membrane protein LptD (OstA)
MLLLTVFDGIIPAETPGITADGRNTYNDSVATADDNAVCHFQDCTLTADHLTYNRLTNTIQGTGHAKLIDPHGGTILAYQITIPDCESKPLRHFLITAHEKA